MGLRCPHEFAPQPTNSRLRFGTKQKMANPGSRVHGFFDLFFCWDIWDAYVFFFYTTWAISRSLTPPALKCVVGSGSLSSPLMEPTSEGQPSAVANSMELDVTTGAGGDAAPTRALPPKPKFAALTAKDMDGKVQFRKVSVPPHRYSALKKNWMEVYTPIYDHMKIDIRMNLKARKVELKTRSDTPDVGNLQKCADFVHAFMLGFDVADAVALLRMDDLFIESFEIQDVKTLRGEHEKRAIGRLSGKGGKTKFTIENCTRTRIVIADRKIHILGSFVNIKVARDSLCSLILGSPAGKVYSKLRSVTARLAERY